MNTRIVSGSLGIREAARVLTSAGLAALPTETVYGLAGDALNPLACAEIFAAKQRPFFDPLIVHVPSLEWLNKIALPSEKALKLAEHFWPGPLTLVLPRRDIVPDLVTSGQSTVAVRMSSHPVFQSVLEEFGRPLAAPSANRFGRISPTTAEHVMEELGGKIPLILDGGPCKHGLESTIVLEEAGRLHILRKGPVTADELAPFGEIGGDAARTAVPGNLKSHYAPGTPMELVPTDQISRHADARLGLLAWQSPVQGFGATEILAPDGNPVTAAAGLYSALRHLDEARMDKIIAEMPPAAGLGEAILDRLAKASAPRNE